MIIYVLVFYYSADGDVNVLDAYISKKDAISAMVTAASAVDDLTNLRVSDVIDDTIVVTTVDEMYGEYYLMERELHGSPLIALAACAEDYEEDQPDDSV